MEQVKIRLAEAPDDQTPIDVRSPNLLVDTAGRRVQVLERITRAEFRLESQIEALATLYDALSCTSHPAERS